MVAEYRGSGRSRKRRSPCRCRHGCCDGGDTRCRNSGGCGCRGPRGCSGDARGRLHRSLGQRERERCADLKCNARHARFGGQCLRRVGCGDRGSAACCSALARAYRIIRRPEVVPRNGRAADGYIEVGHRDAKPLWISWHISRGRIVDLQLYGATQADGQWVQCWRQRHGPGRLRKRRRCCESKSSQRAGSKFQTISHGVRSRLRANARELLLRSPESAFGLPALPARGDRVG